MNTKSPLTRIHRIINVLFFLIGLISLAFRPSRVPAANTQSSYDPTLQTQALLYDEARTVYLGNLARRDNGVPPLRWNRQLTYAARWFSWDSTENEPSGFCGHVDSQGHPFYYRTSVFGYLGFAGAENAFCGYVTPENAIQGWMNSSGHRTNLLAPNSREIGLGYYRRDSDGRGYVTQDFGNDAVYAPVIIENEAISTINPGVNLYIYDRSTAGGFAGLGAATQMMVSNNAQFCGATWESYNANKAWTLSSGAGWREVYVKTRDSFNRNLTVSDTIYLGANAPLNELGDAQMSTTQSQVTLYNLNGGSLPQVQFSPGWMADDTDESFVKWWGNGERVVDADAWGGTSYRLYPGDGESFAWDGDWKFPIQNVPLVAYFRLKVNSNASNNEVARLSVQGGSTEFGPLLLKGIDFTTPNQYQEFALNFTFSPTTNDPFLTFKFWRSGSTDIYVDAVSIFSAPQVITSPLTWSVPGNNYRGQGVWVRYTNGSQFSAISEAATTQEPSCIVTVSGNAGATATTLFYVDGTVKTVTADVGGNYSITVPIGWSGVVTPFKTGYTFTPINRIYNNLQGNQTEQNYIAQVCVSCADVNVKISGDVMGSYSLSSGQSSVQSYSGVNGGPVVVHSTNGANIIASYLQFRRPGTNGEWTNLTQTMALTDAQISDKYVFPRYNSTDPKRYNSIQLANYDSFATNVTIKIGNTSYGPYPLGIGASQNVPIPSVVGGPVIVSSDNGARIIASLYELKRTADTGLYTGQTQMMGLPWAQLSDTYIIPRYNYTLQDLLPYVVFANADTFSTQVTVTIGTTDYGPYTLAPGQSSVQYYQGTNGGPVVIHSNNGARIIASYLQFRRPGTSGEWTGITQTMALTDAQIADKYVFPRYDSTDPKRYNSIQIANYDSISTSITVKIGSTPYGPYTIGVGSSQNVVVPTTVGGPVIVSSDNGARIIASLYELKRTADTGLYMGQTQMMGLPWSQLSDTYIIPRYNYTLQDLLPYVVFGVP